jgi:MFS family permease
MLGSRVNIPQDVFGTKRLLFISLWIFVLGNMIAGAANSLGPMVAGRLISGVGAAGLFSLSCIVISRKSSILSFSRNLLTEHEVLTHERQRSTYMNLINIVFLFCDAAGPTIGGALATAGKWRWM